MIKKNKTSILERLVLLFLFVVINEFFGIIYPTNYFNYRQKFRHDPSDIKQCYSSQRVLNGAIEMYDMDHSDAPLKMMNNLDYQTLEKILVDEKYLKAPINMAHSACQYRFFTSNKGEFSLYCAYHGSIYQEEQGAPGPSPSYPNLGNEIKEREKLNNNIGTFLTYLGALAVVIFI